ncbi:MAG: type II secretion system protein [Candidatus Saccharimonadales bacterium]
MVSTVSLKNKNKGFTIVELLIVIVVIGILATLVIVTFTGIQQKGRNSQRQTDINAVDSQVEAFYAQHGFYPKQIDLADATFVSKYLKGLDPESLRDPKQPKNETIGTTATSSQYSYVASNTGGTGCSNSTATETSSDDPVDNGCDKFVLTANLEGKTPPEPYTKQSN